jgi:GNAT superfamily N-acetyltransferase
VSKGVRVRAVDGKDAATAALLQHLQLLCLDADKPLKSNTGYWWIAYDGALPVGFCGLIRSRHFSDCGYLSRSGVIESHRGNGLQKRMIQIRQRKAKKLGWNWLISDTRDNIPSSNSLISMGFKMYTPSNPWGVSDTLYWRKKI